MSHRPIGNFKTKWNWHYAPVTLMDQTEYKEFHKTGFLVRYLGLIFALLAGLCFFVGTLITKHLRDYSSAEIIAYRVALEVVLFLPFVIQRGIVFTFWAQARILTLRGFLMPLSYWFYVMAIKRFPLAEASAIVYSYPIVTAIIARILLKTKLSNVKILALFINVVGVILVCRFWDGLDTERALGIASAFMCTLATGSTYVLLKKLTFDLDPQLIAFHMTWMRLMFMSFLTEVANDFSSPRIPKCNYSVWYLAEPLLFITLALCMLGFNSFFNEAVKLENATTATAINTTVQLSFCVIGQWLVFGNAPGTFVVIGVLAVFMTSQLINLDTIADKLSPESRLKGFVTRINRDGK